MNALSFSQARMAALQMVLAQPDSSTGLVYLGDVFWQVRQPLAALNYYTAAASAEEHGMPDEVPGRVQSRLADAYEMLGGIDEAIRIWRSVAKSPHVDLATTIMQYRGLLKADFYEGIRGGPLWGTDDSLARLDAYLTAFVKKTQNATGPDEVREGYEVTRSQMLADLQDANVKTYSVHPRHD